MKKSMAEIAKMHGTQTDTVSGVFTRVTHKGFGALPEGKATSQGTDRRPPGSCDEMQRRSDKNAPARMSHKGK
jgi:hypothetical protein